MSKVFAFIIDARWCVMATFRLNRMSIFMSALVLIGLVVLIILIRAGVNRSYRYDDTYFDGLVKLSGNRWEKNSLMYDTLWVWSQDRTTTGTIFDRSITFDGKHWLPFDELSPDGLERLGFERNPKLDGTWDYLKGEGTLSCNVTISFKGEQCEQVCVQSRGDIGASTDGTPFVQLNDFTIRLPIRKSDVVKMAGTPVRATKEWSFP